jgi:hypothetical protein
VKRIRSGAGRWRQQPRIGAPDAALTPNAGLAAITELCDRLGVIGALDAAVGPIKQRDRGFGAGELLAWRPAWRRLPAGCWECCPRRGLRRWLTGRSRLTWIPLMWRFLPTSPLCRVPCVSAVR